MKCKNGHEFEWPAYITQRVKTPISLVADVGVNESRYEISYPVCPVCQIALHVFEAPKKKTTRRRKKTKETTPTVEEVAEHALYDAKPKEEEAIE